LRSAFDDEQRLDVRKARDLHPDQPSIALDFRSTELVDGIDDAARDAILAAVEKTAACSKRSAMLRPRSATCN